MEPGKEWPPLVPGYRGEDRECINLPVLEWNLVRSGRLSSQRILLVLIATIITDDVRPPPVNIITIYVEFITSDANPDPYYKSWIRMEMYKSGSRTYVR